MTDLGIAGMLAATLAGAALMKLDDKIMVSKDLYTISKLVKVKMGISRSIKAKLSMADIWHNSVDKWGDKAAIIFENQVWSFRQLDEAANRVSHWVVNDLHLKRQDVVALYMENRPFFFVIWMGICKAGGITALINYNVVGAPLVHSIKISGAKHLIFGSELMSSIGDVAQDLRKINVDLWFQDGFEPKGIVDTVLLGKITSNNVNSVITKFPSQRLPASVRDGQEFGDTVLLVYTSGTTGLPKAATIKHVRLYSMAYSFVCMFNIKSTDRIYTCLPLYHSAGGLVGVGMMIFSGGTMVLARKFSARQFWLDVRLHQVTVVQYIGELCRYLLTVPKSSVDRKHVVRIAIGNGLRPDIWDEFQDRFNIPEIGEFYGSTEGNAALVNYCTTKEARGCVGHSGVILNKATGMRLVKFDTQTEDVVRDKATKFCIDCDDNETGELLGIIDDNDPTKRFAGYHGNSKATNSKIMHNVFKEGDKYFRTGDLLKRDERGYWHFMDRIGDTFRWKGENVSTTEVAQVVASFKDIADANVYGVSIPNTDGRACMVSLSFNKDIYASDDKATVDLKLLAKHCRANLPSYAVPLFLREIIQVEMTGTFKQKKVDLRDQGIDRTQIKDRLWMLSGDTYIPYTLQHWQDLQMGKSKL